MKILITANSSFNLVNFRSGLIRALAEAGHDIVALVPRDEYTDRLHEILDCEVVELKLDRRGKSLLQEAKALVQIIAAVRRLKPDAIVSYTIKNNLYGGAAARLTGTPILPNITGLGTLFSDRSFLARFARIMYRVVLKDAPVVFFQNSEDMGQFVKSGAIASNQAYLLPGSGVDLAKFTVAPMPDRRRAPVFLLIGRMLWEKGVGEFVEAGRVVRAQYPNAEFWIIGGFETPGRAAIPENVIDSWVGEGIIRYLGKQMDVRSIIADANCVVLPTYYREGTPRALLEAAASGRPIITTDTPGCRDVVIDGVTGFAVTPADADDLVRAMLSIADCDPRKRAEMGRAGRAHIEKNYDERVVIEAYLNALGALKYSY